MSRAKALASKALVVVGGIAMLAGAFVISVAFLAIGLALVLISGGYLWWKTRELRKQLRARMQEKTHTHSSGRVIEGEATRVE